MRKISLFFAAILLVLSLTVTAAGATQATKVASFSSVSRDGSCQITLTASLHLDQGVSDLAFPLPKNASNITLNGHRASVRNRGDYMTVNLSRSIGAMGGDYSFTLNYRLSGLVKETEVGLELVLPLLSGFSYPVEDLEFSITLPGEITAKPAFSSGYHQANIEKDLTCTVSGATISGFANKALKDHETLSMTLAVTEEMFPQTRFTPPSMAACNAGMAICAGLALIYWLIFWRALPPKRQTSTCAPAGYNAGLLGAVLKLQGVDLISMIFSWAQMGYLSIEVQHNGRVLLRKQMEMGNECSPFDSRLFEKLFGKQDVVDTTGLRFAGLIRHCETLSPLAQTHLKNPKTNPKLFRILVAGISMFGAVGLGITLSGGAVLQWLLGILLGGLGFVSGWHIQSWTDNLILRSKDRLYLALIISGFWLLLAALCGMFSLGLLMVLSQLFAGLMVAYGGRRTDMGRDAMAQTLGLRRYLKRPGKEDLLRICDGNPDFFHSVAPYALALGVDKAFARGFGKRSLPPCPYIHHTGDGPRTASQWSRFMGQIIVSMERRKKQLPLERISAIIYSFKNKLK